MTKPTERVIRSLRTSIRARALNVISAFLLLVVASTALPADAVHAATSDDLTSVRGLGALSFPTSTKVPEAQSAFIRGLLLLHLFEYDQAAEAFQKAEQLDPTMVMAYWGEAMTHNHPVWNQRDAAGAEAVLAKLAPTPKAREAKAPTAREKRYLEAVDILYASGPKAERDAAYSRAMERLSKAYPEDDEAKLFYALSILGLGEGVRDVPLYMRAAALADEVFCRNPHHPGAAHYLIHSVDDPTHAVLGLRAARALAEIAPDAAHGQHMTSHIFTALGMWDDDVTANEAATRVVDARRAKEGKGPQRCGHYASWLDYGYLEQGRFEDAKRLLEECRDQALASAKPGAADRDPDSGSLFSFIAMRSRYLLDTEDWAGDVAESNVDPGSSPAPRLTNAFVNGFAAARSGDIETARQALSALQQARRELASAAPAEAEAESHEYALRAETLDLELQGVIAAAAGDEATALALIRRAAAVEDQMAYAFGPPFVDKPAHELLGDELLKAGQAAEAQKAFETALERTPRRTAALLGLARAAAASGDSPTATRSYAELAKIWHQADSSLPALAEVRRSTE